MDQTESQVFLTTQYFTQALNDIKFQLDQFTVQAIVITNINRDLWSKLQETHPSSGEQDILKIATKSGFQTRLHQIYKSLQDIKFSIHEHTMTLEWLQTLNENGLLCKGTAEL